MDITTISQMITSVGFPIACCVAMAWYVQKQTEKNQEQIDTLSNRHKEEITSLTETLNNNTLAIQHLSDLITTITAKEGA